jgi:hypothetical protein
MGSILNDQIPHYGHQETADFMINGDLRAAYEWLKTQFEPKIDNRSGPVKPLSKEEKLAEQNPGIAESLESMPMQEFK